MAPSQIHYLRFTLEAYEGLGVLTTIDARLGLVRMSCSPGCEGEIDSILEAERDRLQLRALMEEWPQSMKYGSTR